MSFARLKERRVSFYCLFIFKPDSNKTEIDYHLKKKKNLHSPILMEFHFKYVEEDRVCVIQCNCVFMCRKPGILELL